MGRSGTDGQSLNFHFGKSRSSARAEIEGRFGCWRTVGCDLLCIESPRVESIPFAQPVVPAVANGHMANFFGQDDVQNRYGRKGLRIANL
jgi:hypothetical protein